MAKHGEIKMKGASSRASVPTPAVRFPVGDDQTKFGQLLRNNNSNSNSNQLVNKRPKKSRGFSGWLISFASKVTIFYLIYAALWTCPSRPFAFNYSVKDARPVCRNLAQAHNQIAPIVTPYLHKVHQKAEPYSRPLVKFATPWLKRAQKVARPIYREAHKRGRLLWKKRIDPARRRTIKSARKQIDPYLKRAHQYHKQNVQPHIDAAHKTLKPYYDIYQRDVSPYVDQAYRYSLQSSSVSYAFYVDKVHPHVIQSAKHAYSFFVNHVDPAIRRFYSIYVRPQLDRLVAKAYERKAHWLGSDAIKVAQHEMKQTAKQADKHAQQAVKKAEQDAIQAQNDPSLIDRVKQAKDTVYDSVTGTQTDRVKVAQLDAELEAEEEKVKDLLEVWENGMSDLIEKEYRLAVDRLAELRNRALADLPDRFGLINEAFVEDTVALALNRVERGLRKISTRSSDSEAKKLADANKLVDQQIAKFDDATLDTKAQISAFYEKLLQEERQVIEANSAEVGRYAAAAKEAYDDIMRDAKFAVTMDEWQGWDIGVRKRASLFAEELLAVQSNRKGVSASSGAIDLRKEAPDMQKEINSLRTWSDKLHGSARKELIAYSDSALAQLVGSGVIARMSDVIDRLGEQASRISTDAAAGMLGALGLARGKLGLGEPVQESYYARAKAYVGSGAGSGSLLDDYLNSLNNAAAGASGIVSSVAAHASSSAVSAVSAVSAASAGAQASAAIAGAVGGATANVKAAAGAVGDAAASAASSASSVASVASRSVASHVGASPTPETFDEYVDAFTAPVDAPVDGAVDTVTPSLSASSVASKISRSVAYAVAGSPTPETISDGVEVVRENANAAAGMLGDVVQSGASSAASAVSARSAASAAYTEAPQAVSSGASSLASLGVEPVSAANAASTTAASSLASPASSAAADSAASAVSALSNASGSAASVRGASPTPESWQDHVDAATHRATSVAASVHREL